MTMTVKRSKPTARGAPARGVAAALAIWLAGFLVPAFGQATSVTISTGEWAPFVSEQLEDYGVAPRIITEAFAKVGVSAQYQFFPWSRAMKEAEEGNVDFSGIWFYNDERAQRFLYSDPVVSSSNVFFFRKDRPFDWGGFENFPDRTIGVTRNYSYGQVFDEALEADQIQAEVAGSDILNFRKLLRGRIDAFPIGELVGYDLLRSEFGPFEREMVAVHPKEISNAPLHLIAVNSDDRSQALIDRFNRGLELLATSGDLQRILDEYR